VCAGKCCAKGELWRDLLSFERIFLLWRDMLPGRLFL